jgi:hypothetical protein
VTGIGAAVQRAFFKNPPDRGFSQDSPPAIKIWDCARLHWATVKIRHLPLLALDFID